jgi:hypothetical protein
MNPERTKATGRIKKPTRISAPPKSSRTGQPEQRYERNLMRVGSDRNPNSFWVARQKADDDA